MKEQLREDFLKKGQINSFYIDSLLPYELAIEISDSFPARSEMDLKDSIREQKYVSAQLDKHETIISDIIYAFQDEKIVKVISEITGLSDLEPDSELYAGGVSLMAKDNFLNPHLDNSHDRERRRYRVLNLLYYVTPDWKLENGGHLELYDDGKKKDPRVIESKFNRLVVMITNKKSIHGVSPVRVDAERKCVSNYYFSPKPAEKKDYFHVTTFYGRTDETVKSLVLEADGWLRNTIRKFFPKGIVKNKHYYQKDSNQD